MEKHNKMLIDATHPEETRVVVLRNGRVEEFDYESAARKLLRGNIYLAKVTRVEPSLQAAFVEYGGNRHGFLAFNEIHPDYYQIPVADREALKQEEAEEEARAEAEADERARKREWRRSRGDHQGRRDRGHSQGGSRHGAAAGHDADVAQSGDFPPQDEFRPAGDQDHPETAPASHGHDVPAQPLAVAGYEDRLHEPASEALPPAESAAAVVTAEVVHAEPAAPGTFEPSYAPHDEPVREHRPAYDHLEPAAVKPHDPIEVIDFPEPHGNVEDVGVVEVDSNGNGEADQIEQVTTEEDALEEVPERTRRRMRQYKIQEVIKRRQIILVQVVKEERGNKGAALTTYISLAGRYTVLMPNTGRGGGISRKITQPQDRKRLKAIAEELDVPEGMGLIIRTAGAARTKQEIKRDYEYLLRLWESVRELTLSSTAPCLVYEEGNLIKRSIRDLYSREIDEVVVAGEEAHHEAQDFMGMLMPGHAENVTSYRASEPLFTRFGIERQLNAMFSPYVTLRSGGYLVINQTEALVAIDVNSGKSTREFSIEETALNTNIEAAEEIARQLKLRDLAGLIVVDFIDMEEKRNNRSVERRLKDALRNDRARIQVGRISHFGLLEMSRQRLRTGVLEGSTSQCPHCQGTGIIRSTESVALAVLRGLEDQLMKQSSSLVATTTSTVALYILNNKRTFINDMEGRHGITITIEASDRVQGANFTVERTAAPVQQKPAQRGAVSMDWGFDGEEADNAEPETYADESESEPADRGHSHSHGHSHAHAHAHDGDEAEAGEGEGGGEQRQGGRRRRRRRGRRDRLERGEGGQHHAGAETLQGEDRETALDSTIAEDHQDEHPREPRPRHEQGTPNEEHAVEHLDSAYARDDESADGTPGGEADVSSENGEHLQGERRRRGRRRGRRGGRGREHREQFGQSPEHGDIAAPDAGQPLAGDGAPAELSWSSTHYARVDDHQHEHAPVAMASVEGEGAASGIVETVEIVERRIETVEPMRVIEYGESAPAPEGLPVGQGVVEAASGESAPQPAAEALPVSVDTPAVEPPPVVAAPEPSPVVVEPPLPAGEQQAMQPVVNGSADPPAPLTAAVETVVEAVTVAAPSAPAPEAMPEAAPVYQAPEPIEPERPAAPPRKGWWQRRFGSP